MMSRYLLVLLMVVGFVGAKSLEKSDLTNEAQKLTADGANKLNNEAEPKAEKLAEEGTHKLDQLKAAAETLPDAALKKAKEVKGSAEVGVQELVGAVENSTSSEITFQPIMSTQGLVESSGDVKTAEEGSGDLNITAEGSENLNITAEGSGEQESTKVEIPVSTTTQKPAAVKIAYLAEKKPAINEHISKAEETKPQKSLGTKRAEKLLAATEAPAPTTSTKSSAAAAVLHFGLIAISGLLIH